MMLRHLNFVAFLVTTLVSNNASSQSAAVVPFEFVEKFPIVQVEIGDRRVPLLFDLGADEVALSADVVRSLEVETLAETETVLDVQGNEIEGDKVRIPRMRIGSLEFYDLTGMELARTPVGSGHLGLQLIEGFTVVVDYKAKTITFISLDERDPSRHGCYGAEIPFERGWPAARAATDFGELFLVWDTGAPVNVIRESVLKRRGIAADDLIVRSDRFTLGRTDFGPVQFQSVNFEQPPGVDGFVGFDFFAKHVVCIDFEGQRFLIRPTE